MHWPGDGSPDVASSNQRLEYPPESEQTECAPRDRASVGAPQTDKSAAETQKRDKPLEISRQGAILQQDMSNTSLMKTRKGGGMVPAVASALIPGVGQLINGEGDKALGVFAAFVVTGLGFWAAIPLVGTVAAVACAGTWLYGIGDGYAGKS